LTVLFVLLAALLLFRALGAAGVPALASWRAAARYALAVMLLFTAGAHFTSLKDDLARMVPDWVPYPRLVIFATGVFEIAAAIGLLAPATRRAAGIALIVFFLAVFPANIHAARAGIELGGRPATPLWLRAPMQVLFIALAWWSTRAKK
jgi:uncharacterized membrane protein